MHAVGLFAPSQTAGSLVAELRPDGPSTCWMTGTSIPSTAVFLPLSLSGTTLLDAGGRMPAARADDSLWWRHERLYRLCLTNYPSAVDAFRREQAELQDAFVRGEKALFDGGARPPPRRRLFRGPPGARPGGVPARPVARPAQPAPRACVLAALAALNRKAGFLTA